MATNKQDKQRQQKLQQHNQARAVAEATAARSARRRRFMIIGGALVAVLLVATGAFALTRGSSSSPSPSADVASGTPVTTSKPAKTSALGDDCVARTGTLPTGSPEVYVPVGPPPTDLQVTDLSTGSGTPVAAGDTVTVNYTGVACSTGAVFDSSWVTGKPSTFALDSVIEGWQKGLVGMLPGGRRLLVIPPAQAYGSTGNASIAPDETLVFVVDLVSAAPTPAGQTQPVTPGVSQIPIDSVISTPGGSSTTTGPAGPKTCHPFADTLPSGAPSVPVPTSPVTASLVKQDLVTGSGAAVAPGSTVTVQYIGVACSTGKIFDSSWANGAPATFGLNSVIKGWTDGLPGMHAGGRRLLVIPPDQAYGSTGTGGSIGPNETLIFVVDMISSK